MRENTFLPCRLYNLLGKNVLRGSGGGALSEKMEYIEGKNGKSYIKSYVDLCKMGIKNQKFLLIRGGYLFRVFIKRCGVLTKCWLKCCLSIPILYFVSSQLLYFCIKKDFSFVRVRSPNAYKN